MIDTLTAGFHNYPSLIKIVSGWIALAEPVGGPAAADQRVKETIEEFLQHMLAERFDPGLVDELLVVNETGTVRQHCAAYSF